MIFLIVTPSLNQLDYLKRCIASVRDQVADDVQIHHQVRDGGSTDGSAEWLAEQARTQPSTSTYQLTYVSKADNGMYDAIRQGWAEHVERCDVVAWLNCDEQYLEGALSRVSQWLEKNKQTEVLFGDALVVQPNGALLCYRQAARPVRRHMATSYLPIFSAAMFLRAPVVIENQLFPDAMWQLLGDVELVLRMVSQRMKIGIVHHPLAAFVDSGSNYSLTGPVHVEQKKIAAMLPSVIRRLAPLWVLEHRIKKILFGAYRRRAVLYALYQDDERVRTSFLYQKAPAIWRSRLG